MCKFILLNNGNMEAVEDTQDFAKIIETELGEDALNYFNDVIPNANDYKELETEYDMLLEENSYQENIIDELKNENELLKLKIEQLDAQLELINNRYRNDNGDIDEEEIPLF